MLTRQVLIRELGEDMAPGLEAFGVELERLGCVQIARRSLRQVELLLDTHVSVLLVGTNAAELLADLRRFPFALEPGASRAEPTWRDEPFTLRGNALGMEGDY